jgi:hypothetical protein
MPDFVVPNVQVQMKRLGTLPALLLLSISASAQTVGSVTLLDGSLRVVRGASVATGAESMRLKQGDILETSSTGFAQLEFGGGTIVALGPSSRLYILRYASRPTATEASEKSGDSGNTKADLILLNGWLKGESSSSGGTYRYRTPSLAATTASGTVVIHSDDSGADLFVESGAAAVGEVNRDGSSRQPQPAKARQFFSRRAGRLTNSSQPSSAFVDAMPRPFRDTLPSRLAHFAGKSVEPKPNHAISFAEMQPWMKMPPSWQSGFVERFEPRLDDPEFRKQMEAHSAEYPEWDKILHPEKYPQENQPTPVSNPDSPPPR